MTTEPYDWPALLAMIATLTVTALLLRRFFGNQHPQDRLMFRRLRAARIDLTVPQATSFILFVRTEPQAVALTERLAQDGFTSTRAAGEIQFQKSRSGKPQQGYIVTAARTVVLEAEEIKRLRALLDEAARAQSGLYLGWQVGAPARPA